MTDGTAIPMTWRRHVDQIRAAQPVISDRAAQPASIDNTTQPEINTSGATTQTATDERSVKTSSLVPEPSEAGEDANQSEMGTVMQESDGTGKMISETVLERRYPSRMRTAPERLNL
jgi:hypothetical protein